MMKQILRFGRMHSEFLLEPLILAACTVSRMNQVIAEVSDHVGNSGRAERKLNAHVIA